MYKRDEILGGEVDSRGTMRKIEIENAECRWITGRKKEEYTLVESREKERKRAV